jgi:hypothetical protein
MKGVDPRLWDLNQVVSAYEVLLQQSAKDEAAWHKTRNKLYAEPLEVRKERAAQERQTGRRRPQAVGLDLASVEAMLAGVEAREASYGPQ